MSDFAQLSRLVDLAGLEAALRLAGFHGGAHRRIRIPTKADPAHPLAALVGSAAFARLVERAAGRLVPVPDVLPEFETLRLAGRTMRLRKYGMSGSEIARTLGVSRTRVSEILKESDRA